MVVGLNWLDHHVCLSSPRTLSLRPCTMQHESRIYHSPHLLVLNLRAERTCFKSISIDLFQTQHSHLHVSEKNNIFHAFCMMGSCDCFYILQMVNKCFYAIIAAGKVLQTCLPQSVTFSLFTFTVCLHFSRRRS